MKKNQKQLPRSRSAPDDLPDIAAPERKSMWQLLGDLTRDSVQLCKKEAQLAKLEVKQNAAKATLLIGLTVAGGLAAFAGLIVTLMGFASLMSMAFGAASGAIAGGQLLIGLLATVAGALTSYLCVKKIPKQTLTPKKTIASIRDDFKKLKSHLS